MWKSSLVVAATAAVLLAVFFTLRPDRVVPIGTGFISHTLCEGVFLSGLAPKRLYAEMVEPVPIIRELSWALRYQVVAERHQVTTTLAGMFKSRAVHRDGVGCLVLRGPDPVTVSLTAADAIDAAVLPEIGGPAPLEPPYAPPRPAPCPTFPAHGPPPLPPTQAPLRVPPRA